MDYNNYYNHQEYPPSAPYGNNARAQYPANTSSSGHGTAVPPSAGGPSPPPRGPPLARPHTTQPQAGYPYSPPPIPQGGYGAPPQRGSIYGHYAGYPPYGAYGVPPMAYADSLPPAQPPIPGPGGGGGGGGGSSGGKSPHLGVQDSKPENLDNKTLNSNPKSPKPSSFPLTNAAAVAKAEAAFPGISENFPDFKSWPAEARDNVIRTMMESFVPKYPPAGYPPPQHYPGPPYYGMGYYPPPPPHGGYMPPPPDEGYGYPPSQPPPTSPQQQHEQQHGGDQQNHEHPEEDEAEEKERIDRERERERGGSGSSGQNGGGASIMPGGFGSSPARETPTPSTPTQQPSNNRPATPPKNNSKSPPPTSTAHNKRVDLLDSQQRAGSMPPPTNRPTPVKTPAPEDMGKHMNMNINTNIPPRFGPRGRGDQGKGAGATVDPSLVALMGPGGQGDTSVLGGMWGVYLFDHNGQKKGSVPALRPKLKGLLGGIAGWIIKDLEPKDSLVIPPEKLIQFYQLSEVEDEPFKWEAFIKSLPPHNLSELYQQLECHHHLVPPSPRGSSNTSSKPPTPPHDSTYAPFDPTIPALTPLGFTHWMAIHLASFPTREHRRLQRILTEFPIQDPETSTRFPKTLPRDTLPAQGDGQVENWWDEAVMSVRRGGYISMGMDDGEGGGLDFGYGPGSEIVRGRERRPYAKSNVASSRGSSCNPSTSRRQSLARSRERDIDGGRQNRANRDEQDDDNFVPPALLRKKTDQKYASTHVPFDDLRGDPSRSPEIERKRKPYGGVVPPNKGARETVYPAAGGGTPVNPRPGGGGMGMGMGVGGGERPGSHGSAGSGGRGNPNGSGIDLTSPHRTATSPTPTPIAHSGGGVNLNIKTPPGAEYKSHPLYPHPYHPHHRYSTNNSTPTTPASAYPTNSTANNTPSTLFSSPQSQTRNNFTPISPLSGGGSYPELHPYPSPAAYRPAGRRGPEREREMFKDRERGDRETSPPISTSMSNSQENIPPPSTSTARIHVRRKSLGAADLGGDEYFGGALPRREDYVDDEERDRDRVEYHGRVVPPPPPNPRYGYPQPPRRERDRERGDPLPIPGHIPTWVEHDDDEEDYYRNRDRRNGGYPHHAPHGHAYGHVRRREDREEEEGGIGLGMSAAGPGPGVGVRRRKSRGAGEFRGDY